MGIMDIFNTGSGSSIIKTDGKSIFNALLVGGMTYGVLKSQIDGATPESAKETIDGIVDGSILLELRPLIRDFGPVGQGGAVVLTAIADIGNKLADNLITTEVVGEETVITAGSKTGITTTLSGIAALCAMIDFSGIRRNLA